jgi:hypothetical protein
MAVLGPGQVHAQKKDQVGKAVDHRTADHGDGGIAIVYGGGAQKGNQRPADHVAESNGGYTGNHPGAGALFEGAQVGVVGQGRPDKPDAGKAPDDYFYGCFYPIHGSEASPARKKQVYRVWINHTPTRRQGNQGVVAGFTPALGSILAFVDQAWINHAPTRRQGDQAPDTKNQRTNKSQCPKLMKSQKVEFGPLMSFPRMRESIVFKDL